MFFAKMWDKTAFEYVVYDMKIVYNKKNKDYYYYYYYILS